MTQPTYPTTVRARAPLRLGLAGGGTDVAPFCDEFGGFVLNATIDKYAYAIIELRDDDEVEFVAADQQRRWAGPASKQLPIDGELALHSGVYNRIVRDFNDGQPLPLRLTTFADAPAGSGLGSSSTLVVAMIKAFQELLGLSLGDYEMAHLAYEIERIDVGLAGGKQDQYAATFGGFNFIEFYKDDRVIVNPLRVKTWVISEFEATTLLYFTGVSRQSAAIIEEQRANVERRGSEALEAMHRVKQEAVAMKEAVLTGNFEKVAVSFQQSWAAKKRVAKSISNNEIEAVFERALAAGALAGKVSGAGGGGFMMLLVPPARRMEVTRTLNSRGGQVMNCHFTENGTQGWKIN
jgi:D-glycero-alpha-D-manno-heptose-7-phosphate kinase